MVRLGTTGPAKATGGGGAASENGHCVFLGKRTVRSAANGEFSTRTAINGIPATTPPSATRCRVWSRLATSIRDVLTASLMAVRPAPILAYGTP